MIEWLREAGRAPTVELSGRTLPIELRRHPTAKRLTLRLAPDGSAVRVTLPRWGRSSEAVRFAASRRDWLEAQLAKVPRAQDPLQRGTLRHRGEQLAIDWQASLPRRPEIADGKLRVGGPRETLAKRLQRWLEGEAQALMQTDLAELAPRAGTAVTSLRLSRAQRRWGSCSSRGVLRINWRLVQAPDFVRRSVVAHEVAHLVHFDHSPAFHALLERIYGGPLAQADSWLRDHGRALYSDFG
ncbi:M48 family metallopeptidase [Qipengyuania spongiae]|uniref:M48 family metallopeptidase n=1 Tax=Qipengyuania spongiae TaxID=2909673 RepID=A0ABY5T2G9_9SPHN|nr:SprT family zinc-dependent metalloprotease [Qipengyuania spongiae]UVI39471.1 M48 family metallopeptidase [Qipengyuania spongiae]